MARGKLSWSHRVVRSMSQHMCLGDPLVKSGNRNVGSKAIMLLLRASSS